MSAGLVTLVALTAIIFTLKAAGPLALGGRQLPPRAAQVIGLLPVPLLAALIVTSTVADGTHWTFDARIAGVAAAGLALARRMPFVMVVLVAAVVTALVRLA